jgi:hypothetical protein
MTRGIRKRRRELGLGAREVDEALGWRPGRTDEIESGRALGAIGWMELVELSELLAIGEVLTWTEVLR